MNIAQELKEREFQETQKTLELMRRLVGPRGGSDLSKVLPSLDHDNVKFLFRLSPKVVRGEARGEYVEALRNSEAVHRTINLVLQRHLDAMIQKSVKQAEENSELVQQINCLAQQLHKMELTTQSTVYHLYNDGEITSQKGGDIYGWRSEFPIKPALRISHEIFKFPIKHEQFTYAVVTEADALKLRGMMERLEVV